MASLNNNINQLILICLLLMSVSTNQAAPVIDQRDLAIERLLTVSGIDDFIKQLPALVDAGFFILRQTNPPFTEQQYAKLNKAISSVFSYESVRSDLMIYFKKHYDGLRFQKVFQLYTSSLVERMTVYEKALNTQEGRENLQKYANQLEKITPKKTRVDLMANLDKAALSSHATLNTQMHIIKNILLAASVLSTQADTLSVDQINAILDQSYAQIGQQVRELVLVSFLYTYRDVSETDMQNYIEIYQNKNLQWFLNLYMRGLESSFSAAPHTLSQSLKQQINPRK